MLAGMSACSVLGSVSYAQSKADLFGDDADEPVVEKKAEQPAPSPVQWRGSTELDTVRMIRDPEHWSNLRLRSMLDVSGSQSGLKWKLGARVDADAAYAGRNESIYPTSVRNDQKLGLELRENYVDFSKSGLEFRLGKQHVVWGEMVGMFVADGGVSA